MSEVAYFRECAHSAILEQANKKAPKEGNLIYCQTCKRWRTIKYTLKR